MTSIPTTGFILTVYEITLSFSKYGPYGHSGVAVVKTTRTTTNVYVGEMVNSLSTWQMSSRQLVIGLE